MLLTVLNLGVIVVALAAATITAYLLLLTIACLIGRARPQVRRAGEPVHRFAILVPAHNEEALIGRLLHSLSTIAYPPGLFDVWVIADNCEDSTAAIALAKGANVLERFHPTERAKGFALRWGLQQLAELQRSYDAYVVFDADSVVAPNFLLSMDGHLGRGSKVVQAYYSVLNVDASPVAGLRFIALGAIHFVRPLGRSVLHLSVGLKGNGMCFAASVLEQFGWNWFTLAEDVEFHLTMVRAGQRVDFAADTWVLADMPVSLHQAESQNARWERGRLELVRTHVPGLIGAAFHRRSFVALDAAAEQLIPPVSVPFVLGAVSLAYGVAMHLGLAVLLGSSAITGQLAYLLIGAVLVRAPLRAYTALAYAPIYVIWKLALYATALLIPRTQAWVRTARTPSGE